MNRHIVSDCFARIGMLFFRCALPVVLMLASQSGLAVSQQGGAVTGSQRTSATASDDAPDSGGAKARVVVNQKTPEATKGFVYFPTITCRNATSSGKVESFLRDLSGVLADYTQIEVKYDGPVALDSPRLKKYPIICINLPTELTPGEERGLQDYLTSGGFVFFSPPPMQKGLIREFFLKFAKIEIVPESNPVYTALYENTVDGTNAPGVSVRLDGILIADRLGGVSFDGFMSNLSRSAANERYKKALTNIVVYAVNK
jgi:hypothetical protein